MSEERHTLDINLVVKFADANLLRGIHHALMHQDALLHEILRAELGSDPAKFEAITASLKTSSDALAKATADAEGATPAP